jgi:hypothetical protein
MAKHLLTGKQMPGGLPGQVYGPSGRPCYRPSRAAAITGLTERHLRSLEELERDTFPGVSGVFYLLDSVHALAEEHGRPVPSANDPLDDPAHLRSLLDDARAEIAKLEAKVELLELDNGSLTRAHGELTDILRRRAPSS